MKTRLDSHFLLRKIIYNTCFEKLSLRKVLIDKKSKLLKSVATGAIIFAAIFEILFFVIYSTDLKSYSFWLLLGALSTLIIHIISMILSVRASRNYIKTEYPYYIKHMEHKILSYEISVLKAIRINKLSNLIYKKKLNKNILDTYISYFDEKSESIKSKNWLPISFFAVFSLPIWNAYINKIIPSIINQKDWVLNIIFLVALLLFVVLIFLLRTILTSILFKKAENYRQLNELLKIIKESID
ncbi:hypothetical protein [Paenibacillus sp. EKM211P]|uniref:hypothetical protein n=1 Tax=Paenibacillus sp. EKM211P TaxID=1683679 RepID=UPI0013E94A81|nr:hypothetical protein [Paenibacillus sp. EKM211P]KAF6583126.1 hypothetical protein G9G57_14790 [Paenibacillus sp. EKM211P]